VHVALQLMPAGELVTVPLPLPVFLTVSAEGPSVNVAVMAVAEFTATVQVVPPLQPGPTRLAVDPDAGIAVSVTDVPYG
jgi:hypothetical protein